MTWTCPFLRAAPEPAVLFLDEAATPRKVDRRRTFRRKTASGAPAAPAALPLPRRALQPTCLTPPRARVRTAGAQLEKARQSALASPNGSVATLAPSPRYGCSDEPTAEAEAHELVGERRR